MNKAKADGFSKCWEFHYWSFRRKPESRFFQLVTECLDSGFHRSDDFDRITKLDIDEHLSIPIQRHKFSPCQHLWTIPDFDGSVQSTKGHAEGTSVGFNKKKKGSRSYYSLFCTVAQTGQFFDLYHRPGNVHDSNGADQFIMQCFDKAKKELKNTIFESRMDSAFFSKTSGEEGRA